MKKAAFFGVLALSTFLWTACQDQNPASQEKTLANSPSVNGSVTETPKDICSQPGPITRGLGTPRCNMHVTEEVCGCDGKTYQNGCLAWTYDVNVAHKGACTGGIK